MIRNSARVPCESMSSFVPVMPGKEQAAFLSPRIKLQAVIGAERAIAPLAFTGFVVFAVAMLLGPGRKNFNVVGRHASLLIAFGVGGTLVVSALVLWLLIDNYYVLDSQSRRILLHKGFWFSGTEVPFLEAEDVLVVGLDCTVRRGKRSQIGWWYTPCIADQRWKGNSTFELVCEHEVRAVDRIQ